MVAIATLFGKNGLQSWLLQRISAIILGIYILAIAIFWLQGPNFNQWQNFVHSCWGRPSALAAVLSLVIHAWIGVWTVTTDYIKATLIRLLVQLGCIGALMFYSYWGIKIIWL